jgi:hypothetical protein
MQANVVGFQNLFGLASDIIDAGLHVDVIDTTIEESAVGTTDKTVVNALLTGYAHGDLVLSLGKLDDGRSLVALKIDRAYGGEETLKKLWLNCPVAKTTVVQSEDGCAYLLMKYSGNIYKNRVPLGDGLAMISDGNYIVVPSPDGHCDGWWKNFPTSIHDLADVPAKLAALL